MQTWKPEKVELRGRSSSVVGVSDEAVLVAGSALTETTHARKIEDDIGAIIT